MDIKAHYLINIVPYIYGIGTKLETVHMMAAANYCDAAGGSGGGGVPKKGLKKD